MEKIGLAVVNGVSLLGWISVYLFKCNVEVIDVNGFWVNLLQNT